MSNKHLRELAGLYEFLWLNERISVPFGTDFFYVEFNGVLGAKPLAVDPPGGRAAFLRIDTGACEVDIHKKAYPVKLIYDLLYIP